MLNKTEFFLNFSYLHQTSKIGKTTEANTMVWVFVGKILNSGHFKIKKKHGFE